MDLTDWELEIVDKALRGFSQDILRGLETFETQVDLDTDETWLKLRKLRYKVRHTIAGDFKPEEAKR